MVNGELLRRPHAATIRINAHLVQGFLQTPAYARAVISGDRPVAEPIRYRTESRGSHRPP
jgi:hypothetical protein